MQCVIDSLCRRWQVFYGVQSAEARLCARLRRVYQTVMTESANLLMYFGDEFGEKLISQSSTPLVIRSSAAAAGVATARLNIGTVAVVSLCLSSKLTELITVISVMSAGVCIY